MPLIVPETIDEAARVSRDALVFASWVWAGGVRSPHGTPPAAGTRTHLTPGLLHKYGAASGMPGAAESCALSRCEGVASTTRSTACFAGTI